MYQYLASFIPRRRTLTSAGGPVRCAPGLRRSRCVSKKSRRGAAAVEFAVVCIPFFLLVFGMFEIGRMMMVRQILTNASREGARAVILESATVADVETMVTDYAASCSIPGATAICSPNDLNSVGPKEPITVTVSVPFSNVSWLPGAWFFGQSDQIVASAQMGREILE